MVVGSLCNVPEESFIQGIMRLPGDVADELEASVCSSIRCLSKLGEGQVASCWSNLVIMIESSCNLALRDFKFKWAEYKIICPRMYAFNDSQSSEHETGSVIFIYSNITINFSCNEFVKCVIRKK